MGGYGSTRWWGHTRKRTVEESLVLDVQKLARDGLIVAVVDRVGVLEWRLVASGKVTSSVNYNWSANGDGGVLALTYRAGEQTVFDSITVVATAGNVGGTHWYALCPTCDKRVRKFYLPPAETHFACRTCGNLTYRCNQESRSDESLVKMLAGQMGTTPKAVRRALRELKKGR